MTAPTFIDTNILVYAYDGREPAKQEQAVALLDSVVAAQGVISTQVVAEFCNVMLTKRGVTMRPADLVTVLDAVLKPMVAHTPDAAFYGRAVALFNTHNVSFYDALIIQAALDLGCQTLYSEDLQAGQTFGDLTVVNPFA